MTKEHCPHCGRGSNFKLPVITIDWDEINRQQFECSRAHLSAKLERIMSGAQDGASHWSQNWFTKAEMTLIDAMLKTAHTAENPARGHG